MKNSIFGLFLTAFAISCSTNNPSPIAYKDILGSWQIENSGVTITFDVIKIKNPSFPSSYPYDPKTDSIFTTNALVTYLGKTGQPLVGDMRKVNYVNGFYSFTFGNLIGQCPVCAVNGGALNYFIPNTTFTEMKSHETDPNGIDYPYDGSWVGVTGYDGTFSNNQTPIFFKDPIILKRTKGPY